MRSSISSAVDRLLFGPDGSTSPLPVKTTATVRPDVKSPSHDPEIDKNEILVRVNSQKSTAAAGDKKLSSIAWHLRALFQRPYATWRPSFFQPRALIGLAALCVTFCCVFASLAILVASDKDAVKNWPIQPTVYLAIVTAISNASLALARMESVPISWWYSISRGRSIGSLERQWQTSRSVIQAITNSRHLSLLNFACLLGALVVVDGPFLQRASTVITTFRVSDIALEVKLIPELPTGFSGIAKDGQMYSRPAGVQFLTDYASNVPMNLEYGPRCNGTCRAKVLAPGVEKTNCSSQTWPITYDMLHSANASWGPSKSKSKAESNNYANYLPLFFIHISRNYEQSSGEAAQVTTGIASWSDWRGSFVETVCYLVPAVLEYQVSIHEGNVALAEDASEARVVRPANNTQPLNRTIADAQTPQNDTMDAITVGMSLLAQADAKAIFTKGTGNKAWTWDSETYNLNVLQHQQWSEKQSGGSLSFSDPMPGIISSFNQLFFRAATLVSSGPLRWDDLDGYIDPGLSAHQTIKSTQEIRENVFHSDLRWYAAAAILELVTVFIVLPMFYGWWTLGCDLSMSPFAVALAFDSAILKNVNSATGSKGVVEEMGDIRLKMGAVGYVSEITGLTEHSAGNKIRNGRFGVGISDDVVTPRSGDQFLE